MTTSDVTAKSAYDVSEFTIAIPDEKLDDMYERLRRTRFPKDFGNDDWEYGYNTDYARELVRYWLEDYDWRDVERRMNELPHFKMTLMDIPVHFIHAKGTGQNSMPLLLHHGWPWTFWDVRKVIGPFRIRRNTEATPLTASTSCCCPYRATGSPHPYPDRLELVARRTWKTSS